MRSHTRSPEEQLVGGKEAKLESRKELKRIVGNRNTDLGGVV